MVRETVKTLINYSETHNLNQLKMINHTIIVLLKKIKREVGVKTVNLLKRKKFNSNLINA
jgi:hypothetical protein